ncbi:MAG TPA: hypothetical protein VFT29_03635, partial [Gemmatimonadaceae bacterium]|nr:hypothetical protein [Gemmatimonadaceae bacterium]
VVTLAHTGPTVTPTVTSFVIPAGATYGTFDVQTSGVGVDSIIASASGFLSDTTVLLVTTPHFVVPDTSIEMERGGSFFRIDVADSLGNTFNTRDTLVLTGSSSDSSVVIPFDPGSIADLIPATWRNGFVRTRMQDTGTVTITIKETSGLVVPLVVSFTAKLNSSFRLTPSSYDEYDLKALGLKQRTLNGYKASSNSGDLFLPKFSSTDTSVLRLGTIDPLDPSILQYVVGGSKPGSASVVVTGPGHVPAVSPPIQVGVPRLLFVRLPDTVSVGRQDFIRVELTDHTSRFRVTDAPVRVRIEEADGGMIPSDADIPAGSLQTGNVPVTFTRAGSLRLVVSELSIGETVYRPDTARLTVSAPSPKTIRLPVSGTVGLGQRVHLPVTRLYYPAGDTSSASVATRTGRTQVPGMLSHSEITLAVVGRRTGEDFVVVSGPGLAGDSTRILVTEGRMSLYVEQEDSLRVGHTYRMVLASTDSTNAVRSVDSETLIAVATSGGVTVTDSTGATLSSIRLIPGAAYSATQVLLKAQTAGEATVTLSRPGYVPLKRALTVKP